MRRKLSLSFMDNQSIFKYSWKDRNMGIDLIPIRTTHFHCCAFLNCIQLDNWQTFKRIFANRIGRARYIGVRRTSYKAV